MTQPPVTVPQARSTILPGGKPAALTCTLEPTTAGLSYERSSDAFASPSGAAVDEAATTAVDEEREQPENVDTKQANSHTLEGRRLLWRAGGMRLLCANEHYSTMMICDA